MKRFQEFIAEQSRALLYHATSYRSACGIIEDNQMNADTDHKGVNGISLTRNYEFALNWVKGVIFVLNQDLLRNKHKIIPYDYYRGRFRKRATKQLGTDETHEFEEFVIGYINPISAYLESINIVDVKTKNKISTDYVMFIKLLTILEKHNMRHLVNKEIPRMFKAQYLTSDELYEKYKTTFHK